MLEIERQGWLGRRYVAREDSGRESHWTSGRKRRCAGCLMEHRTNFGVPAASRSHCSATGSESPGPRRVVADR